MDIASKIQTVSKMTGETDLEIVGVYMEIASEAILNRAYPFERPEEFPSKYDMLHLNIGTYLLNRRGADGQTSHSENGVSMAFESGFIPDSMLETIVPFGGQV